MFWSAVGRSDRASQCVDATECAPIGIIVSIKQRRVYTLIAYEYAAPKGVVLKRGEPLASPWVVYALFSPVPIGKLE